MRSASAVTAAAKNDLDLHVLLIINREKISKSKALVLAYLEGVHGLKARLD